MPEVLSQAEIESLLAGLPGGKAPAAPLPAEQMAAVDEAAGAPPEAVAVPRSRQRTGVVKPHNFRAASKFTRDQLRAIQMIHEDWGRQLSTTFAANLRSPIHFDVAGVHQLPYHEFMALLTDSIIYIFSSDIFEGPMLLEVNKGLGFWLFERLMGGEGHLFSVDRSLTEIEGRVMDNIAEKLLATLGEAWSSIAPMRPRIEQRETDPQFVQIAEPAETVVAILMEVKLGDSTGSVNVCIPGATLEKVSGDLSAERWRRQRTRPPTPEMMESLRSRVRRTHATLSVVLGRACLTPQELLDMREGDVIPLDAKFLAPLEMRVESLPKFHVRPGVVGRKLAVQIVGLLGTETSEEDQ